MGGHFTRRMKNRHFRMKSEEQKEIERIERMKREQSNDGLLKGDKEALDRMRKLDEKSGYRKQEP